MGGGQKFWGNCVLTRVPASFSHRTVFEGGWGYRTHLSAQKRGMIKECALTGAKRLYRLGLIIKTIKVTQWAAYWLCRPILRYYQMPMSAKPMSMGRGGCLSKRGALVA